ncbi:MAG: hypothetical protein ABIM88_07780 [candidate division WOR-3 bacterium]
MKFICEVCGKEFKTFPSWLKRKPRRGTRFCSYACAKIGLGIKPRTIKCAFCGREFVPQSRDTRYCSRRCACEARVSFREERACAVCGKRFTVTGRTRNRRYCSRECLYSTLRGPRPGFWTEMTCPVCGKVFMVYKSETNPNSRWMRKYCSRDCAARARRRSYTQNS